VHSGVRRLQALGQVNSTWADTVLREFAEIESNPQSLMITPLVLEIIARNARP
jgi:hypothetical protein